MFFFWCHVILHMLSASAYETSFAWFQIAKLGKKKTNHENQKLMYF